MTVEAALLRAILDAPDDDGPRLVYADWLTERGDPRGEFIVLQCAGDPRAGALFEAHGAEWGSKLEAYRRGFVEVDGLSTAGDPFGSKADALFTRAPIRELAILLDDTAHATQVAACPHLARLRSLSFQQYMLLKTSGAEAIAASPFIANLTSLHIAGHDIGDQGLAAIAASPYLMNLRTLDIGWSAIKSFRPLLDPRHLPALRVLHLPENSLFAPELAELLAVRGERLTTLTLQRNPLFDDGVEVLARWPGLADVVSLDLTLTYVNDRGFEALLASPHLARLSTLLLESNWTDGPGHALEMLARSERLAQLTHLNLARNHVGDTGVRALAGSPFAASLVNLDLRLNDITEDGLRALLDSPHLRGLQVLGLSGNPALPEEDWQDGQGGVAWSGQDEKAVAAMAKRFGRRIEIL